MALIRAMRAVRGLGAVCVAVGATTLVAHAQPRLEFDRAWVDFGEVDDSRQYEDRVAYRNTGDETLVIGRLSFSCSCMAMSNFEGGLKKLAPGESGVLNVRFNPSGKSGRVVQTLTIESNDPSAPESAVRMRAEVTPIVLTSPTYVRWDEIELGRGAEGVVTMFAEREDFAITGVEVLRDDLERVEWTIGDPVRVIQNGKDVTLLRIGVGLKVDSPTGVVASTIVFRTNDERRPEIPVRLSAEVVGDLRTQPRIMAFGRVAVSGQTTTALTIRSESGEPFRVLGFEGEGRDGAFVSARLDSGDAARIAHRITVILDAPKERTLLDGALVVKTDREGEPEHRVPFSGVVR